VELKTSYKKLDKKEFEELFKSYFVMLCAYAGTFVKDHDSAKEIVHDVFIKVWEKREDIDLNKSVKSYLYSSVHNRCLNYIRDNKKFDRENVSVDDLANMYGNVDNDKLVESENIAKIKEAIDNLPGKCKQVFIMNRFENLKYREIAEKQNVSVKTVESQMSKALKILRNELSEFLFCLLLLLFF